VRLARRGRWSVRLRLGRQARYRVEARYRGASEAAPSRARSTLLRVL
jgi:hypothetical protein